MVALQNLVTICFELLISNRIFLGIIAGKDAKVTVCYMFIPYSTTIFI